MEAILLSNQVANAGSAAGARTLGGLQTWLNTNGDFGSAGVAGSLGTTARTDSSEAERTFTETLLKTWSLMMHTLTDQKKYMSLVEIHRY